MGINPPSHTIADVSAEHSADARCRSAPANSAAVKPAFSTIPPKVRGFRSRCRWSGNSRRTPSILGCTSRRCEPSCPSSCQPINLNLLRASTKLTPLMNGGIGLYPGNADGGPFSLAASFVVLIQQIQNFNLHIPGFTFQPPGYGFLYVFQCFGFGITL